MHCDHMFGATYKLSAKSRNIVHVLLLSTLSAWLLVIFAIEENQAKQW